MHYSPLIAKFLEKQAQKWPSKTRLLDFACGDGYISKKLSPYCSSIVGVDIDKSKIDKFNNEIQLNGVEEEEMNALCLDIDQLVESNLEPFDVIVVSMVLHHFERSGQENVLKKLTKLLRRDSPTQLIIVIDVFDMSTVIDCRSLTIDHRIIGEGKQWLTESGVRHFSNDSDLASLEELSGKYLFCIKLHACICRHTTV